MSTENDDKALAALATLGVLARMAAGKGSDTYKADVDRTGDKIILPEGAYLPDVIEALQRKHKEEDQKIKLHRSVRCQPWDGSIATMKAIEETLGFATATDTRGFFGSEPPQMLDIEVAYGKRLTYPWGKFILPGMENASVTMGHFLQSSGRIDFALNIECKRRYESRIRRMMERMAELAVKSQLHNGKAFALTFVEKATFQGTMIFPEISFFPLSNEQPVYRQTLEKAIERNIFVPIRHSREMKEMGERLKRGVLLAGPYGTGKTLLASQIAREAQTHGWTFIYVKEAHQLKQALDFAHGYQPAVVFCEDVDRIAGEQRTDAVNDILNQLDGIDTKAGEILTILTSNNPEHVNPAMRRPGRIDVLLEVSAPDAEACERMMRLYGGSSIAADTDLSAASTLLAGQSPAKVREAVSRAKMETLRRTKRSDEQASGADLALVAEEVVAESRLFVKNTQREKGAAEMADGFEVAARVIRQRLNGKGLPSALAGAYDEIRDEEDARG